MSTPTSPSFIIDRLKEPSSYAAIGGILLTAAHSTTGSVALVCSTLAVVSFGAAWAMKEVKAGIATSGIIEDAIKILMAAPVKQSDAPAPTQPPVNP